MNAINVNFRICDDALVRLKSSTLIRICQVDPSILMNWTGPFPILGVSGVFFIFILFRIDIPVSKQ